MTAERENQFRNELFTFMQSRFSIDEILPFRLGLPEPYIMSYKVSSAFFAETSGSRQS
jgi:hypothetical protein